MGFCRQIAISALPADLCDLCELFTFDQPLIIQFRSTFKEILEKMEMQSWHPETALYVMKRIEEETQNYHGFRFAFQLRATPDPFVLEDCLFLRFGIITSNVPENIEKHNGSELHNSLGFIKECHWTYSYSLRNSNQFRHCRSYQIVKAGDDCACNDDEYEDNSLCLPMSKLKAEDKIEFKVIINLIQWNGITGYDAFRSARIVRLNVKSVISWDLMKVAQRYPEICIIGAIGDKMRHQRWTGNPPSSDLSDDGCWYIELDSMAGEVLIYWCDKPQDIGAIKAVLRVNVVWDDEAKADSLTKESKRNWSWTQRIITFRQFRRYGYGFTGGINSQIIMTGLNKGRKVKEITVEINVETVWDEKGDKVRTEDWNEFGVE